MSEMDEDKMVAMMVAIYIAHCGESPRLGAMKAVFDGISDELFYTAHTNCVLKDEVVLAIRNLADKIERGDVP